MCFSMVLDILEHNFLCLLCLLLRLAIFGAVCFSPKPTAFSNSVPVLTVEGSGGGFSVGYRPL